jgi:lipopolysaccharide export system protein LptC
MADIAARIPTSDPMRSATLAQATRRTKAFAAAKRHSSWVRFLRVAILGGAVGTVALFVAIAVFDPFGRLVGSISIGNFGLDGTKVTMIHPRLAGFRKDGRPYLVNAERAIQDALHPTLVELRGIDADIAMAENGSAHMTANTGFYDSEKEHMDVSDHVHVKSPQYDVWLKSAGIDFKNGRYISNEPVTIVTSNGATLSGDSISAIDNGKELIIVGNVKTRIQAPSTTDETKAELKGGNP